MVSRIRLNSVLRAAGRALSTTAGRKQRPLEAEKTDHVVKTNFSDVQNVRLEQAKHSVLISCPPKIHETKFLRYLSQHGEVASHFFFDGYGRTA